LEIDTYFEIQERETTLGFVVLEMDIVTTSGVCYATVDPVSLRNKGDLEEKEDANSSSNVDDSNNEDSFWLGGRS
jgi:hypothetical protein